MISKIKNIDKIFMQRCLELAKKGSGHVSPNPLVGCVITKNRRTITEGYHALFGSYHAEINAIKKALKKRISLKNTTLYVNLEPCNHFGKTPPCVDEIINYGIKKVVIGTLDPNPLVSGKGIKKLIKNGIKVKTGVLQKECLDLNKFYFKNIKTNLPYITLKSAQTLDGKIADKYGDSKWITSLNSRKLVHKLRNEYDAVLVGRKTVEVDDPQLTVRLIRGRNPYRIVIDKDLKLNTTHKIFSDKHKNKTIILTSLKSYSSNSKRYKIFQERKIKLIPAKSKKGIIDLGDALKKLSKFGIFSILVEGGAKTFSEFLKQKMVDEILIFIAPKIFGSGIKSFPYNNKIKKRFRNKTWRISGNDLLINLKIN